VGARGKQEESGAPAWMVTFGDMMSLLLCFFVILVALSEIKEDKFETVMRSFQEAFGGKEPSAYRVPGNLSGDDKEMINAWEAEDGDLTLSAIARARSEGTEMTVVSVKRGKLITMGGKLAFHVGSAKLKPEAVKELKRMAPVLRRRPRMVEVIGHAAPDEPGGFYKLACRRSQVVADVLAEAGVPRTQMKLICAGPFDTVGVATESGPREPGRVEILVTEEFYSPDEER